MIKFSELCLLLSPLSVPSLILTYRLVRRKFLNTVFNQHIALMFLVTGLHVPIMTASSGHLVATSLYPADNSTQPEGHLAVCKWWYSVHCIWIILIMFGCLFSLFFRYILVLFPDRGLVAKENIQNTQIHITRSIFFSLVKVYYFWKNWSIISLEKAIFKLWSIFCFVF